MGDAQPSSAELRKQAELLWSRGMAADAIARMRQSIDCDSAPATQAAYLQLAGYQFHGFQFDAAVASLKEAVGHYPNDRSILMHLGGSLARAGRFAEARGFLERLIDLGPVDMHGYDALAMVMAETGDRQRARSYGSEALRLKDEATKKRRGRTRLHSTQSVEGKRKIIAFSLFGTHPRYLRGALLNVLEAKRLCPDWTCRFYVDGSTDRDLLATLQEEGAELIWDEDARDDRRKLLTRRFLVNDAPDVGYFLVRDCDSVIGEREARTINEWLSSGFAFHAIRDWYTHTDPMLAGLWGGIAGVYPDMAGAVARYAASHPATTNWDQAFLREVVWPDIRDSILVHDRLFVGHAVRPLPGLETGNEHIGQNEFLGGKTRQSAPFAAYAERVPALRFSVQRA